MTDRVIPSAGGDAPGAIIAQLYQHAAGSPGWVVPSGEELLADYDSEISNGFDNYAFDVLGFNTEENAVSIRPGEGFVGGAWVCRDSNTLVDNPGEGRNDIYLGWNHGARDELIIDVEDAFHPRDLKLKLYETTWQANYAETVDVRPTSREETL